MFATIPISSIVVDRDDRQRREIGDVSDLAASIAQYGLINPITLERGTNRLIAGERRFEACKSIPLDEVPVRYFDELSELEQFEIELEENLKRQDLTWQETTLAIASLHMSYTAQNAGWTIDATANRLNLSSSFIRKRLTLQHHMDDEDIRGQKEFSTAFNLAMRKEERKKASENKLITRDVDAFFEPARAPTDSKTKTSPDTSLPEAPEIPGTIRNANFLEWADTYTGEPFNLIHCDFPYGVSTGDKEGQSAAKYMGTYDDGPEVYRTLLRRFAAGGPWLAESAHLIFWLAFDYYHETVDVLEAAGWSVNPRPLIWHKSDNVGIIPDPNRGPRWTYETAIFATRGDRKIVRAVANSIAARTTREYHTSEKPREVLHHFFRMTVDEYSRVLDPTCGSGNAIREAVEIGADYALGLELNPMFASRAMENLAKAQPLL